MATEKLIIGEKEVLRAIAMATTGKTPDGKIFIFTDEKFTNLRLQVQAKTASWIVRWKSSSVTIAYAYPAKKRHITAPSTVRKLAKTVLDLLVDDPDKVKSYLA